MPAYVLVCTKCQRPLDEVICSMATRDKLRCPDKKCRGKLTNDYSRMETSNFSLKGDSWPGKQVALENKLMKEGA